MENVEFFLWILVIYDYFIHIISIFQLIYATTFSDISLSVVYFKFEKVTVKGLHNQKKVLSAIAIKINDIPAGNYMFKVNNRNTRTRCEIWSKLTIKIPERRQASFWYL